MHQKITSKSHFANRNSLTGTSQRYLLTGGDRLTDLVFL
jgi:hypothetical protein